MLTITIKILSIIALLTFLLISIWSFVLFKKVVTQFKYGNYILEKIFSAISIRFSQEDKLEADEKSINLEENLKKEEDEENLPN